MCKNSLSGKRVKGTFTLIELLVVIAIIAILAGILMPALSSARERGKSSQCTNNLKQCSLGIQLYIEDHGVFPLYYLDGSNTRTFGDMICRERMQMYGTSAQKKRLGGNYVQTAKLGLCPSLFPYTPQPKNYAHNGTEKQGWHISTYGACLSYAQHPTTHPDGSDEQARDRENMRFNSDEKATSGLVIRPSMLKNASRFFMIADSASIKDKKNCQWYWVSFNSQNSVAGTHNGRANVAWLDGHVDTNDGASLRSKIPALAGKTVMFIDTASFTAI